MQIGLEKNVNNKNSQGPIEEQMQKEFNYITVIE